MPTLSPFFERYTTDEAGAKLQSNEALLSAILDDDVEDVRAQLQGAVDPNAAFTDATLNGKEFVSVTPLAAAVLQRNTDIMQTLIEYKASVESKYSFVAWAEETVWTGTVVNACIPSNNLDMLMYLIENNAEFKRRRVAGCLFRSHEHPGVLA